MRDVPRRPPVPAFAPPRAASPLAASMLAALLVAGAPGALEAQRSVLLGRVVTDSANLPIAGAEVVVEGLRRAARADDEGAFALRGLPAGLHVVVVRRLGYEPLTARVRLTGTDTVSADFALARRSATLARVEVRSAAPTLRAAERDRARENAGAFVGPETLRGSEHRPMSDVLRRVAGVTVQRVQTPRGSINAAATSRGGAPGSLLSATPKPCFFQVYVDGVRVYTPDQGDPPDVDGFRAVDLEAIEVYRGTTQTPPQYAGMGAICGTILFWSRTR